jgi:hypothetical protein
LVVGEVAATEVTRPDASDTARIALDRLAADPDASFVPEALDVIYLRDADVRIGWAERGGAR